jgi:hypothetical protein
MIKLPSGCKNIVLPMVDFLFKCEKKSHFQQHCKTETHKIQLSRSLRQTLLTNPSIDDGYQEFCMDLCAAFIIKSAAEQNLI